MPSDGTPSAVDFAALLDASHAFLSKGLWDEAAALCRRALPADAVQARFWIALAKAYVGQERLSDAIAALHTALARDAAAVEAHRLLTGLYRRAGQWTLAVTHGEAFLAGSNDPDALGEDLVQSALFAFAQSRGKTGGAAGISLTCADLLAAAEHFHAAGNLVTVDAICGFGIRRMGGDPLFIHHMLVVSALANLRLGRQGVADGLLHHLVGLSAETSAHTLPLVGRLCQDWPVEEAMAFQKAYGAAAESAGAWRHMLNAASGMVHGELWDDAIALTTTAIAAAPGQVEPLFLHARLLARSGKVEPAIAVYETLLARHPAHWLGHYDIVRLLRLVGRYEEADAHERRQQSLPRSDGDSAGFHEMGESGIVDMNDVAVLVGKSEAVRRYWHRSDDIRFFPTRFAEPTMAELIRKHFLEQGRALPTPIFGRDARLVTFGSCFATYLRRYLEARNKTSETIQIAEELNNTWALRSYLEWCFTGDESHTSYWFETAEKRYAPPRPFEDYRRMMQEADGFVLTLGLSEVWRDRESGGVFWKGVPDTVFREGRHEIVLSTPQENFENIRRIREIFREHCGDKPVIFTVSPVPLKATFRGIPCLEADCASKSVLRSAVEMLMAEKAPNIHYWPSYEIVRWLGAHLERSPYGSGLMGNNGTRHVAHDVVDAIVSSFIQSFFEQ